MISTRICSMVALGIFIAFWGAGNVALARSKDKPKPAEEKTDDGEKTGEEAPAGEDAGGGDAGGEAPAAEDTGGGGGGHGAPDGFGKNAKGAGGSPKAVSGGASAVVSAMKAGGNIQLAKGDYDVPYEDCLIKSNTTFDGGGATLWFPANNHNGRGVEINGTNVIFRNVRIRNAGDNLGFGSAHFKGTKDVLVENVTVSGSGDDGLSPAYDCKDITIRWTASLGSTRACFIKYGGTNVTIHHTILSHYFMRGPLIYGGSVDFRNNLVEHWGDWGSRTESGGKANFVNSTWRFEGFSGGKKDAAILTMGGSFYSSGNQFIGCSQRTEGSVNSPVVQAPPINGQTDAKTSLDAVLNETTGAGCMPRDAIDKAYLASKAKSVGGKTVPVGLQVEGTNRRGGGSSKDKK